MRHRLSVAGSGLVFAGVSLGSLLPLSLSPRSAAAATSTANFAVTVTVQAVCRITTNSLTFGVYVGEADSATTTISLTCTNTTPYNVGLSAGNGNSATVTTRYMMSGTTPMLYGLYRDSAYTRNWGVTSGSDTVAGTGNGAAQVLTVYGRIAAGEYVKPGAYTDTIIATVTY
jgi:spore coat protein U-like protein